MANERKVWINFIKVISILFVIYNHIWEAGFLAYQHQNNLLLRMIMLAFSIICKSGVPLFLMCSESLLLAKKESIRNVWKKRVLKYVLAIILFTCVYYVYLSIRNNSSINWHWIFKTMWETSAFSYAGAYWFYMLILPFLYRCLFCE